MATKVVRRQRWFASWRASRRALPGDDAADQGTAFGLEMSLLEMPSTPATPTRPGWIRRLTLRLRPTS